MPPTSGAYYYNSLRVHHQVNTWKHLKTLLNPKEYGFRSEASCLVPIFMNKEAAPKELLKDIRFSCQKEGGLCKSCTCTKMGLPCNMHCKCQSQCDNGSVQLTDVTEELDDDDDDDDVIDQ